MPMQRPQEAETARPLLPTQLCVSRQEEIPVHPRGRCGGRARRVDYLQEVSPANRPMGGVGTPTRRLGTQVKDLIVFPEPSTLQLLNNKVLTSPQVPRLADFLSPPNPIRP